MQDEQDDDAGADRAFSRGDPSVPVGTRRSSSTSSRSVDASGQVSGSGTSVIVRWPAWDRTAKATVTFPVGELSPTMSVIGQPRNERRCGAADRDAGDGHPERGLSWSAVPPGSSFGGGAPGRTRSSVPASSAAQLDDGLRAQAVAAWPVSSYEPDRLMTLSSTCDGGAAG